MPDRAACSRFSHSLPSLQAFPGKQLDQSLIKFFSAQPVCKLEQQRLSQAFAARASLVRACRGCGQQSLRVEQGAWRTRSSDNMRSPCAAHALPQHLHGRVCGVRGTAHPRGGSGVCAGGNPLLRRGVLQG